MEKAEIRRGEEQVANGFTSSPMKGMHMTHWARVRLADVAEFTNGGAWKQSEYVESGIPVARVTDFQGDTIDLSSCKYLPHASRERYGKHQIQNGDLVIATVGSHPMQPASVVGRPVIVPPHASGVLLNQNAVRIAPRDGRLDKRFLGYIGKSPWFRAYIIEHARGSANQVRVAIGTLKDMLIPLPDPSAQKRIGDVLCAYDDLIENNTRRIAILEEMAQAIYREWFVNLRFPGHEQVAMVESELGPVPAGWEVCPIGDVVETLGGGTPSTKRDEYWIDGDIVWFSPSDLTSAGTMFISDSQKKINKSGLQKSSAKLFPPYSVMMTSRATIGVTAICTRTACTNQGFITCVPNEALSAYQIYFWISESKEKIITLASGATFKEINKTTFRELPILVPDRQTTKNFAELLNPLGRQIENLQDKNTVLRRTRDLLLPRLIAGEIDMAAMEDELAGVIT